MKKLRMTLATSMLLFLTAIVLQSCLDDWDDKYDTLFAVGTVKVIEGKDYYFSLDEGSKLYPSDTTYVHDYAEQTARGLSSTSANWKRNFQATNTMPK